MITKDGRDVALEELTAENYVVPAGEEKSYHCIIEVVQYDAKTGKKLSRPRLQKFGRKVFENNVRNSLRKQGFEVKILHNPTEWFKQQAVVAAANRKAAEEARAKAEQEKFDAAVAAAVERALSAQKGKKEKKTA